MAQRHGGGGDPLLQQPRGPAAEGAERAPQHGPEQPMCPAPLTGLLGTPLCPQPRCSQGVKQRLPHICQDHRPPLRLGDHGSEAPVQPRRQQEQLLHAAVPSKPAALLPARHTVLSCEVCPASIPWGSHYGHRGQTAHWGWERVPHTPPSTMWCGLAAHTINRNFSTLMENQVHF